MKKAIWAFFVIIFFLLFKSCLAVTVNIDSFPQNIGSDEFIVNVSIYGASSGKNYLRANLYKDGTDSYFGETFNGSDWYGGSDSKQYFPIIIENSKTTASASLKVRVGIPEVSDYDGLGQYKLRVKRYTSSGSPGSEEVSTVNIAISIPTYTPTLTPTPTQSPTNTPTITKSPTLTPTNFPTKKLTYTITPSPTKKQVKQDVLAESSELDIEEKNESEETNLKEKKNSNYGVFFICLGLIILISCAILIVLKLRK